MKKIMAVIICLVLVLSLAACGTGNQAQEATKAAYDEGYKAGYEEGIKDGKQSVKQTEKVAKFSGEFTASVEKLIPDYVALPGNTVAVVHFFQDGPFLLRFNEDMTGKLEEGKAYVFQFSPFEVVIPDAENDSDIKDCSRLIKITGYRLAGDDEVGLSSKTPTVEISYK